MEHLSEVSGAKEGDRETSPPLPEEEEGGGGGEEERETKRLLAEKRASRRRRRLDSKHSTLLKGEREAAKFVTTPIARDFYDDESERAKKKETERRVERRGAEMSTKQDAREAGDVSCTRLSKGEERQKAREGKTRKERGWKVVFHSVLGTRERELDERGSRGKALFPHLR